jgi:hypothetical protein
MTDLKEAVVKQYIRNTHPNTAQNVPLKLPKLTEFPRSQSLEDSSLKKIKISLFVCAEISVKQTILQTFSDNRFMSNLLKYLQIIDHYSGILGRKFEYFNLNVICYSKLVQSVW